MARHRCVTPRQCGIWGCTPLSFPAEKRDPNPQPPTPGQRKILDAVPRREPGPFDVFQSWPKRPDPDPVVGVLDKLGDAPWEQYDPLRSNTSTGTASTTPPSTLNLAALEKLLADIPPEPIGEWMREQGFPPETSLLILPETMREQLPPFAWPRYVRFSVDVGTPMLLRDVLGPAATVDQIWRGMVP